jgi:hypothetical protein
MISYILFGVVFLGTGLGVGFGLSGTPVSYGHLSPKLIEAVNYNYREMAPTMAIRLVTTRATPDVSEQQAVSLVSHSCGIHSRFLAVGLVKATWASGLQWAVFFDPPGNHFGISGAKTETGSPPRLNWYAAFVSAGHAGRPFCTFGHYGGLPRLPIWSPGPSVAVRIIPAVRGPEADRGLLR